jgi:hypothetical protein
VCYSYIHLFPHTQRLVPGHPSLNKALLGREVNMEMWSFVAPIMYSLETPTSLYSSYLIQITGIEITSLHHSVEIWAQSLSTRENAWNHSTSSHWRAKRTQELPGKGWGGQSGQVHLLDRPRLRTVFLNAFFKSVDGKHWLKLP